MNKTMTCVVCPKGCTLDVAYDDQKIIEIKGNQCKRGEGYAHAEIFDPTRILTATVKIENSLFPVISVKTSRPIPKDKMIECMKTIQKITITSPVKTGDVIVEDLCDTQSDLIATDNG